MSFSVETFFAGAAIFLVGIAFGYWLLRWKERNLRAAQSVREKSLLENARRDAEAVIREARLSANEDSLKIREQTEQLFASKRQEMTTAEQRLYERETLVNQQLEKLVQQEKSLGEEKDGCAAKEDALGKTKIELDALLQRRRAELENISQISSTDARAALLKQVEQDSLRDAGHLTRHILEEAKLKAEELMTRDPRAVERKKFGRKKARKRYQFSKR